MGLVGLFIKYEILLLDQILILFFLDSPVKPGNDGRFRSFVR